MEYLHFVPFYIVFLTRLANKPIAKCLLATCKALANKLQRVFIMSKPHAMGF